MEFKIETHRIYVYVLKDQLTITLSIESFVLMTFLFSSNRASVTILKGYKKKKWLGKISTDSYLLLK